MSHELKPCPFCGAHAAWLTGRVGCESCEIWSRNESTWNLRDASQWIPVSDRLPPDETSVVIFKDGDIMIGELRWDVPHFEDNYSAFRYWDNPNDDGQDWEWDSVTHWMPLPGVPS
jgi:hypothetical protein